MNEEKIRKTSELIYSLIINTVSLAFRITLLLAAIKILRS